VQRKITKRGDAWAMVTLEDLEGGIDVLLFPSAYQRLDPVYRGRDRHGQGRLSRADQPDVGSRSAADSTTVLPAGRPLADRRPPGREQLKTSSGTHPGSEVRLR
jgi:DNA polymerase-3 subunit alpha